MKRKENIRKRLKNRERELGKKVKEGSKINRRQEKGKRRGRKRVERIDIELVERGWKIDEKKRGKEIKDKKRRVER